MRKNTFIVLASILFVLTGCAALEPLLPQPQKSVIKPPQLPPGKAQRPAGPLPPSTRPTYNLMGYPPASKEGYIDGCETAKKSEWAYKDRARYESEGQYRTGWDDGYFICSRQNTR